MSRDQSLNPGLFQGLERALFGTKAYRSASSKALLTYLRYKHGNAYLQQDWNDFDLVDEAPQDISHQNGQATIDPACLSQLLQWPHLAGEDPKTELS